MKIEKLNKDNIKEFIRDMKLTDTSNLESSINKRELYAIKNDDIFYLGFDSLAQLDTIAILYYNPKMSNEIFYKCMDFLDRSIVVQNHLIVEVFEDKYIKLLDEKYRCKELFVTYSTTGKKLNHCNVINFENEKFIQIEMMSIKYFSSSDMAICNLVKQNIQDENIILDLHNKFTDLGVKYIGFIVSLDKYDYFNGLGYECVRKSYVIN